MEGEGEGRVLWVPGLMASLMASLMMGEKANGEWFGNRINEVDIGDGWLRG